MGYLLMNRFFRISIPSYESIRNQMDEESGYPNEQAETWFTPAADCQKDADGNCLIAAIPPIADRLAEVGEELTQEQYEAALPKADAVQFVAPTVPEGM
jgi:hypothetical protein